MIFANWLTDSFFPFLLAILPVVLWMAFWLWAGLYFAAPILVVAVWVANHRYAGRPAPSEPRLGGEQTPGNKEKRYQLSSAHKMHHESVLAGFTGGREKILRS